MNLERRLRDVELIHCAMLMTGPMNEDRFWFLAELYLATLSRQ